MRRAIFFCAILMLSAGAVLAQVLPHSDHTAAGTDDYTILFDNACRNVIINPLSEDVQVVMNPFSVSGTDTMTVRTGYPLNALDLQGSVVSVRIIRTASTAVDVYWWR